MNKSRSAPALIPFTSSLFPNSIMELHEYNTAALKLISESLFPRTIAQENEELHDQTPLKGMKEILRIASYADDLSQAEILDGMRSIERIAEQTLAQYPLAHEEQPA